MFNLSTLLKSILLSVLVFVAFWIRVQAIPFITEGHFTGVDAYLYYFQAQQISEHGTLPARDMHRWLPVGRDNDQLLNLYSYVLAYTHKSVAGCFRTSHFLTLPSICRWSAFVSGSVCSFSFSLTPTDSSFQVSSVCFWQPSRVPSTEALQVLVTEMHGAGCSVSSLSSPISHLYKPKRHANDFYGPLPVALLSL